MSRIALLVTLCLVTPAVAGVVSRDLFEPGDGLLTYDPLTNREWLDFSATEGLSLDELEVALALGQRLSDFQIADVGDVQRLFNPTDLLTGPRRLLDWIGLMGFSGTLDPFFDGGQRFSGGVVRTSGHYHVVQLVEFPARDVGVYGSPRHFLLMQEATLVGSELPPTFSPPPPPRHHRMYWLYRDATPIPEPTSVCLALVGCLPALHPRAFA